MLCILCLSVWVPHGSNLGPLQFICKIETSSKKQGPNLQHMFSPSALQPIPPFYGVPVYHSSVFFGFSWHQDICKDRLAAFKCNHSASISLDVVRVVWRAPWSPILPNLLRGKRGEGDALSTCQKIVADEAVAALLDRDDKVYVFHSWLAAHFPRTLLQMVSQDACVVCFTFCNTFKAGS